MTATWLLPIAIIPGTWQVYQVPPTPQIIRGEAPSEPQHQPNETDDVASTETQKEGGLAKETIPSKKENIPEAMNPTPDEEQAWGSSSYSSNQQQPQGYWEPSPSVAWVPQDHVYPHPMYSSSSSFHYSHYPPGAYFTPIPDYATSMHGYYQPMNPEQTHQTYDPTAHEPTAPPPVVVHTVPLPSSRPNTPPRW